MSRGDDFGLPMYELLKRLFPICRSLTGEGNRQTLGILKELIPLQVKSVASGTQCFDWVVPPEWNIQDGYIKDSAGNKIVDFKKNNLHVVGYSTPISATLSLEELKPHLHTLPDQPNAIPYVTSYYNARWGFCLTHEQFKGLLPGNYEVKIESELKPGVLNYADLIVPGKSEKEILVSTYFCHPSMANNELSGPVIATFLAKSLLAGPRPDYTYRFVFVPETIGSIVYLSQNLEELKKKVIAGYVVTCAGDPGNFSYLSSRSGNALTDRVTRHVLKHSGKKFVEYDYLERGSDERQYCSPGADLPIGSLMRSKYGRYPEYHTSLDNLDFVTSEALGETLAMYLRCFQALEENQTYRTLLPCEPQLGKRGLYPTLSTKQSADEVRLITNLVGYSDGKNDLLTIAEKLQEPIGKLAVLARKCEEAKVIERVTAFSPPSSK